MDCNHSKKVREKNIKAALAVANLVRSSLGPKGLDKLLVDNTGEITVTNDGATILKKLDVKDPSSKLLVQLAELQDKEVGDGTTSVVLIAAELLKNGEKLISKGIHPANIIRGYRMAMKEALLFLRDKMSVKKENLDIEILENVVETSIASKMVSTDKNFFKKLVIDAMLSVKTKDGKYPVSSVHILKSHGCSLEDSILINGFVLNASLADPMLPTYLENAKIALFDIGIKKEKLGLSAVVQIVDIQKLKDLQNYESEITRKRMEKVISMGVRFIATTKSIDPEFIQLFAKHNVMAVRHISDRDIEILSRATNTKPHTSWTEIDSDDFESSLGFAKSIYVKRIEAHEMVFFGGCGMEYATLLLRGPSRYVLDEVNLSINDSLSVLSKVLESKYVIAGAGAPDIAICTHIDRFSLRSSPRESLAIKAFSDSFLVIPTTIAINSNLPTTKIISQLRAIHFQAYDTNDVSLFRTGIDIQNGTTFDAFKNGVIEPLLCKMKIVKTATEAAITILRIDESIKLTTENDEENRKPFNPQAVAPKKIRTG